MSFFKKIFGSQKESKTSTSEQSSTFSSNSLDIKNLETNGLSVTWNGGSTAETKFSRESIMLDPDIGNCQVGDSIFYKYWVVEKIYQGGMGKVMIVHDTKDDKKYAIKCILSHRFSEEAIKQFSKEADRWLQLSYNPNIVTAHSYFIKDNVPYLVLEYIAGKDLRKLLKENTLSLKEALEIIIGVTSGLDHMFKNTGLIHRDLKPENILIDSKGTSKVTDFGLSIQAATAETKGLSISGTLPYMAPEQFDVSSVCTQAVDVYAVGIILFEITTGSHPFYGKNLEEYRDLHLFADIPTIMSNNYDIPEEIKSLIRKCLSKIPTERYRNIRDVLNELLGVYTKLYPQSPITTEALGKGAINQGETHVYFENDQNYNDMLSDIDCFNKANSFLEAGNKQKAIEFFNQFKRKSKEKNIFDEEFKKKYFQFVSGLYNSEMWSNAVDAVGDLFQYQRAVSDVPNDDLYATLFFEIEVASLFNMGNYNGQIQRLNDYLEIYPNDVKNRLKVADTLGQIGEFKESQTHLEIAYSKEPSNLEVLKLLAVVSKSLKQYDEAVKWYNELALINPSDSNIFYNISHILCLSENWDQARDQILKALQIEPNNEKYIQVKMMIDQKNSSCDTDTL